MKLHDELKYLSFNSTMVRLKAAERCRVCDNRLRFNSTMVRLKGDRVSPLMLLPAGFNSTMVRLKGIRKALAALKKKVSIPQWFD